MTEALSPTLVEAHARIAAIRPDVYARTRNAIDGAVSGLSPYITHGFLTLADVLAGVAARHELGVRDKFVFELGWRDYFRHVWRHRGDGIFRSLHEGPLPDETYDRVLPADIRLACTGEPVVDEAVRTLYATGGLHNHARMWLASYIVHLRKVHWRVGADWLYGHLLDGDLASNHLAWQWVAGTSSHKPYLFNAENVARYAPASWHSPGGLVDKSYEALDRIARDPATRGRSDDGVSERSPAQSEPPVFFEPPDALALKTPDATAVAGQDIWLVHPWCLGALPVGLAPGTRVIGLFVDEFHRTWPWSEKRWRFVGSRMAEISAERWHGNAAAIGAALKTARSVRSIDEPHLAQWLPQWAECEAAPALFRTVERRCDSFSQWWTRATRGLGSAAELLALAQGSAG